MASTFASTTTSYHKVNTNQLCVPKSFPALELKFGYSLSNAGRIESVLQDCTRNLQAIRQLDFSMGPKKHKMSNVFTDDFELLERNIDYKIERQRCCESMWEAARLAVQEFGAKKCGIEVQIKPTADLSQIIAIISQNDPKLNEAWNGIMAAKAEIQEDLELREQMLATDNYFEDELQYFEDEQFGKEFDMEEDTQNEEIMENNKLEWEEEGCLEGEEDLWHEDQSPEGDLLKFDSIQLEHCTEQAKQFVRKLSELAAPSPEQKEAVIKLLQKASI